MCHRNHRYPIVDFGIGDRDVSVAFPFLTLEILKFQPWKGFLFLKIQKFAVRRWLGRPREEAVRRGVVRREIPIYALWRRLALLWSAVASPTQGRTTLIFKVALQQGFAIGETGFNDQFALPKLDYDPTASGCG